MAKSKKKLVFVLLCIVVIIFGGYKIFNKKNNPLSTETIVSNVKSEKVSMPYINPAWTEYMKLSDEEKEKVEQVPQMYIYNYIPEENMYGDYSQLPSSYNVRDEYPTTLYDQGNEGLCWAYATIEMLESNLKVTKNIDAKFSIRQLDCLTANSSYYKNNYNPYSLERTLHNGNYFASDLGLSNSIVASGVMPVLESKFNVNADEELDISEVADVNNVDYTVVSAVNFPRYEKNEEYINMLKSFIKRYGAVYITTVSPTYYADRVGNNNNPNIVDYNLDDVGRYGYDPFGGLRCGHAMIIVGWDDSFDVNNDGVADGTWILQNSWNEVEYDTYYAPYTTDFFYIYGVKEIVEKNWDNSYNMSNSPNVEYQGIVLHQNNENYKHVDDMDDETLSSNELMNRNTISGELIVTYSKSELKKEKLNSINFVSASQNSKYKVYISRNGNRDSFEHIKDVDTDMPGLYTVNFDNIELESDKFAIKIVSDNGALYTIVNAFTSNISENEREDLITSSIFDGGFNLKGNYEYNVNTYVKEINYDLIDPETVEYKLHDIDGNELTNNYTKAVTINKGKATGIIEIPRKTQMYSKVYLDVIYNKQVMETLEIIYCPKVNLAEMSGKGTEEEPYVITNAEQLSLIANSPSAYYILANDIDLKYNANNDATFNKGIGWKPISNFNGVFDGNGHVIKNMYIYSNVGKGYDESNEKNVGLFAILDGATIKNLKITEANINSDTDVDKAYVGILAGSIKDTSLTNIVVDGNLKRSLNSSSRNEGTGLIAGKISNNGQIIDKIACIGSIEYGNIRNNGGIFGIIEKDSIIDLNNIFVNAYIEKDDKIRGVNIGGIAGICETNSMNNLKIHNSCMHLISGEKNSEENVNIDALVGQYPYNEKIGEIQNVLVSNENINSITQYNPSANENVRTGNVKNIPLEELKFNNEIWEYKGENPYPTLKVYPYYFATDIDVPETIYLTTARQPVSIPAKIVPESASCKEIKKILPDDQIKVRWAKDEKIYGGYATSDDIVLTLKTIDGTNIVKEIPVVVLDKPTINLYDVDNYTNFVIDNILPTTIEHYKENIDIKEPFTVKVFQNDEEITDGNIASGMKTRIYAHGQLVEEYTSVVPGDVNGDGKIGAIDAGMVGQYLNGINIVNEQNKSYVELAMDFTRDGKVDENDKDDIQKYSVGIIERNEEEYYGLETPIEPYKINKYDSDEEKKTISNIFPATIEHYKENINIQNPYTIKVFQGEEEVTEGNIATGMITKIYLNDEIVAEYTNIVPGDVYADGKVSGRDGGMIYQYFVGMLDNFYGTPQYYAMDFTRDGKIRLNDAELIKRYVVKLYEPSEEDYYGENN